MRALRFYMDGKTLRFYMDGKTIYVIYGLKMYKHIYVCVGVSFSGH
jgi:hypothetical protein